MNDIEQPDLTPPHDYHAEQCVLGSMILSADAAVEVAELVTGADFYRPAHALLFDILTKLHDGETPVDPVTVNAHLTDTGDITRVGGGAYLHTLLSTVPTAANAGHYAGIVRDRAQLRRLIETGTRIVQLGYGTIGGSALDVADAVEQAQMQLHAATVNTGDRNGGTWADMAMGIFDTIEENGKRGDKLAGIPTSYTDLDRLTGGLRAGQLIVVAGRPGAGKSVCVVDMARCAVFRHGLTVAMFSLEMSKQELGERVISAETRVPLHAIRSAQLEPREFDTIGIGLGRLEGSTWHIHDDAENLTLAAIRARARRIKQRTSQLDLVIVDYLQLIPSAGTRAENRQQEVAEQSRALKLLAKELGCPVIAVAQLNRGPEQRTDKRPQLADLRESGAIEQDADVVIFVHREDYYDKESPRRGEADLIVAKHRNGPRDTITVAAQLHLSRFVDMAREADPASAAALAARGGRT